MISARPSGAPVFFEKFRKKSIARRNPRRFEDNAVYRKAAVARTTNAAATVAARYIVSPWGRTGRLRVCLESCGIVFLLSICRGGRYPDINMT